MGAVAAQVNSVFGGRLKWRSRYLIHEARRRGRAGLLIQVDLRDPPRSMSPKWCLVSVREGERRLCGVGRASTRKVRFIPLPPGPHSLQLEVLRTRKRRSTRVERKAVFGQGDILLEVAGLLISPPGRPARLKKPMALPWASVVLPVPRRAAWKTVVGRWRPRPDHCGAVSLQLSETFITPKITGNSVICWFGPGWELQIFHTAGSSTGRPSPLASLKIMSSLELICSYARPALPPMTSGMVAATGSGSAERRVSADVEPVVVLAETSGSDDAPQAATEARSVAARAGLKSLVTVMFPRAW